MGTFSVPSQRGGDGGGAVDFGCWRTGHGDHRPTLVCLAHHRNSSFFTLHLTTPSSYFDLTRPSQKLFVLHASLNYATVLLWFAGLFTPLSHGEEEADERRREGGAVDLGAGAQGTETLYYFVGDAYLSQEKCAGV